MDQSQPSARAPPPPYSLLSCESSTAGSTAGSSGTNHSCLHFLSQGTYIPCKPLLKNLMNLTIVSKQGNHNDETYTLLVEQGSERGSEHSIPFKRLHLHAKKHKNIIKNSTKNPHVHYCSIHGQIHEINKSNGILKHIHSEGEREKNTLLFIRFFVYRFSTKPRESHHIQQTNKQT